MQTVVLTFDSGLTSLLPIALRGHPIVCAWAEGTTLKHAIEALGVPHTEIGQVPVDGRTMVLEALSPARGHVAVSAAKPFLPAASLRFLCDAYLGATTRLLRMAGFDIAYDNNYADVATKMFTHREGWIVLSRDHGLLKRHDIQRGVFICAHESQTQMREIVTRLRLAGVAEPFSCCLECNMLLWVLSPEEASASVPPRMHERQRLFSACDVCRCVYWSDSHQTRMNTVLADMLWPEAGASTDSAETVRRTPRTGSVGA